MRRGGALLGVLLALGLVLAPAADGKTFKVTRLADSAPNGCGNQGCTLREAIIAANNRAGADVVELKSGKTYPLTIGGEGEDAGATGDLDSTGPLTLRAEGKKRATIDADGLACCDRILHLHARGTIAKLVMTGGSPPIFDDDGGAIRADAAVRVLGSVLRGNLALNQGSAISSGDVVGADADIFVARSRITGNDVGGSALMSYGDGSITVRDSVIRGNSGEAILDEGGGGVTVRRTTLAGSSEAAIREEGAGSVQIVAGRLRNTAGGAEEHGEGGLRVVSTRAETLAGDGFKEFEAGSLTIRRSAVIAADGGADREGVQEFGDGGLAVERTRIARSSDEGVEEFGSGQLRLERARIVANGDNAVQEFDGGGVVVTRSRIAGNDGRGIGFFSADPSRVVRSTIAGNETSNDGGGIVHFLPGPLVVKGSTIANNIAGGEGGGIALFGGADLRMTNSTVAGNRTAARGGGLYLAGAGTGAKLRNATIARNRADTDGSGGQPGGGLLNTMGTMLDLTNTLVARNRAGGGSGDPDCAGVLTGGRRNLIGVLSDASCDRPGTIANVNARIGPLRRNGGATATVALKNGSPAIDAARKALAPKRDQRGRRRDSKPDIGAFER